MIALMLTIELLSFQPQSFRAAGVLRTMSEQAPKTVSVRETTRYTGGADVLIMWGPGAPDRVEPMAKQVAAGGHSLVLDLAYWHRDRKWRVSIDAAHPQAWILRKTWPADRFIADRVPVAETWKPNGPVIVAGIGRKARVQYGDVVGDWERSMMAQAAERWPGRRILYRKKQQDSPVPAGAEQAPNTPIDQLLTGASLVITWHSNVAVDAIRMGIPVICRDGAAAAVCAAAFDVEDPRPLASDVRDRFLRNLAWFQWSSLESRDFWAWVPEVLA